PDDRSLDPATRNEERRSVYRTSARCNATRKFPRISGLWNRQEVLGDPRLEVIFVPPIEPGDERAMLLRDSLFRLESLGVRVRLRRVQRGVEAVDDAIGSIVVESRADRSAWRMYALPQRPLNPVRGRRRTCLSSTRASADRSGQSMAEPR